MISPEVQQRDVDAYLSQMTSWTGRTWRAVVVDQDLDKSGRNLQQVLTHLEEVEALGGQVVSVTEPMDVTTAIGQYMRSQTLSLAQLQSQQIGEGWKRVLQDRVDRGLPTHGRERYGYLAHRSTHTRTDGALRLCPQGCSAGECQTGFVPNPETAPVVEGIYEAYVNGKGFNSIAKALNDRGDDAGLLGCAAVRERRPHRPDVDNPVYRRQRDRHRRQRLRRRSRHPQRAVVPRSTRATGGSGPVGGLSASARSSAACADEGPLPQVVAGRDRRLRAVRRTAALHNEPSG